MADELLPYYEKELAFIRQMGAEFAREHPKIAGRLGINAESIEDPHVSRLIEAFAYLNARIQHKLDDDFPELTDALLEVILPHYLRPIPAMTIVQFDADQDKLEANYRIDRQTLLETEPFQGETCLFSTVYNVDLHPLRLAEAQLLGRPFTTPGANQFKGASSVLKLAFTAFKSDLPLGQLKPDRIRLYLKGQPQHINPLYEMLLNQGQGVTLTSGESDTSPITLPSSIVRPVGFAEDEGLLPYPDNAFLGYRLLTEFFAFSEKFMFIELTGLADAIPAHTEDRLELYLYLNQSNVELEHNVSSETFQLGCAPAINLFPHRTDPIKLDHSATEYLVNPDTRRPAGYEVYSIDRVTTAADDGSHQQCHPLYGINHGQQVDDHPVYWFAQRRSAKMGVNTRDEGNDMYISLVDLDFNPNNPDDLTLHMETTCSNRDLPAKLPFNDEQPVLQCVDIAPPCKRIKCITQPGPSIRPGLRNHARWRLVSHLSLNHLSITGGDDAAIALKEILHLYDFRDSSINRALIDAITRVTSRSITAPLTIDGRATLCRGIEIEIELDEAQLAGSSSFLFASILEHFFALYCSINSFTRVLVKLKNKEGYLKKCPPRAGEKILL